MLTQYLPTGSTATEIASDVEAAVREGRLRPGAMLPPVRLLAGELGLSPATVASAYRELRLKGIARGHRRAGTRITGAPPTAPRPPLAVPAGARNLISGSPDPALLPAMPASPAPRRDGGVPVSPRLYGDSPVSPRLAELAAGRLQADGIDAMHLAVVGGALDGVERVLGAWLRPGDRAGVEDPGYPPLLDLLTAMDIDAVPMTLDERGVRPEAVARAIEAKCQAVILVPRAQSPTGAAWDNHRAAELSHVLASAPELLVIEDDHAGEVAGAPATTTTTWRQKWAVLRSVSKSLGPDLRLAVLAGDPVTTARVEGRQALGTGWVSYLLQEAVAELWEDPQVGQLLEQAAAAYTDRRERLIGALATYGIAATGQSGLAVWVPVTDEVGTTSGLLDRGWAVAPGERFRLASGPGIRIGIATLGAAEASQLAADLSACLRVRPRRTD
ncbi:MAG TPA: aminotransferase class I/II-fold pyridoxal phosphate-dependent enzyme [Streptosporangiaceae bacterium]|nr:aminotransferase class I/II-fold pyridoxal phosphate-dependent enzyme [Streptosporangiaceae bacterium]